MRTLKRAYIEITNVCNLDCSFCPKTGRRKEFMSEPLFEKILQQLQGVTEHIYFHIMGEPLLHPQIGSFLDISHSLGFKVNLTTNGTLIDKTGDMLITKPALRLVSFSLHSFDKETDNSGIYLDKVFSVISKAQSRNILCGLRLWNVTGTDGTDPNRYILSRIEKEFGTGPLSSDLSSRGIEVAKGVYLNFAREFEWPGIEKEPVGSSGFCHGLRDQIGFLVDGTVVPCCLDSEGSIALGNINTQNFSEIIKAQRSKAIYDGFSSRKAVEELCKKCGYRTRFNG